MGSFDASARLWSEPDEGSARAIREMDQGPADVIGETGAGTGPGPGHPRDRVGNESRVPLPDLHPESLLGSGRMPPSVSLGEVDIEVDLESAPPEPMVGDVRRVAADRMAMRPGPDRFREGRVTARRRRSREQAILDRIEGLDGRRGLRWSSGSCIVLLLLLVMQYAWFMAGDLAAAWPMLGPALDEFCEVSGCESRRRTGDDGIRVVSRAVRPHAEYSSALSVSATLENRSPESHPFPVVVFVLYGRDGRAVASRAFEPAEYLDGGTAPPVELEPGRRVDITFDLVAPSEVAVSFDLRLI